MTTHLWERGGLGTAPFRFARFERASKNCRACGRAIKNVFWVQDISAAEFAVGSECIKKAEPDTSRLSVEARAAQKVAIEAENQRREAAIRARFKDNPELLSDRPSIWPNRNLREWAEYALEHGGPRKRAEVCGVVEERLKLQRSN